MIKRYDLDAQSSSESDMKSSRFVRPYSEEQLQQEASSSSSADRLRAGYLSDAVLAESFWQTRTHPCLPGAGFVAALAQ